MSRQTALTELGDVMPAEPEQHAVKAAGLTVEARDRGELASSAAIVPGRKDKGGGGI